MLEPLRRKACWLVWDWQCPSWLLPFWLPVAPWVLGFGIGSRPRRVKD